MGEQEGWSLTLWWKWPPTDTALQIHSGVGTVLLANSDVSAGKFSSPQVPPRCREHKNPELFQAYESVRTTAEERFFKSDQKWGKGEAAECSEHSWVTGHLLMRLAPGLGGTLKPSEPCCSKAITLACLDIHLSPTLFSLLDSV